MKLLYINVGGSTKITSVYKKIFGQINAFEKLGVKCTGIFLSPQVHEEQSLLENIMLVPIDNPASNFFFQLKLQHIYTRKIISLIEDTPADIIYFRYSFCNRALVKAINKTSKKVVIERNSKVIPELRNMQLSNVFSFKMAWILSKIQDYYIPIFREQLFGNRINKAAAALVCVTQELSDYYKNSTNNGMTITNGISVKNYPIRVHSKGTKFTILILDGTSVSAGWHGTERLIRSIKKHKLELLVEVRIAGNITEVINEAFVTQLGFLKHPELEIEFNRADIGTGNLCLYKKGLKEASVLKNREYLTRGLPILYAFDDLDIDNTAFKNYCFKIPNDNSLINLPDVLEWCKSLQLNNPKCPTEMNELAKKHLDFSVKIEPLVHYLKALC